MIWNYTQPVTIKFGNGIIKELPQEIKALNRSRGIIITSASFKKRGFVDSIIKDNFGVLIASCTDISPNPDITEVEKCISIIKENKCDFIVALGGGSVLDCAKAAAVMCTSNRPVSDYMHDASLLPDNNIPMIAIPTTAGTGSEVTNVSVLSDHVCGIKKPLFCNAFYPALALIDPELTYSVPRHITACTGMDVFCHALEAYWNKNHQPICDALAIHALKLVFDNLPTACENPNNPTAREKMAEASILAGLAFAIPKTNSSHSCSYPLTNLLGIPHGEACALTIDYFLAMNIEEDDGRLLYLANALGYSCPNCMLKALRKLKEDIGIMPNLKQFNITDKQLELIVSQSKTPSLLNNPAEITDAKLFEMYRSLL